MTQVYNKSSMLDRRRELRRNATKSEELLWSYVRREQRVGTKIKRQYNIQGFVVDFYVPSVKLAIELDGASHDLPFAEGRDVVRQKMIEEYGIQFLRFSDKEIFEDLDKVLQKIDNTIQNLQQQKIQLHSPYQGEGLGERLTRSEEGGN
jgi:very-short-patch-repair endonuclease